MRCDEGLCRALGVQDLVIALTAALDAKSPHTRGHCDRVAALSWALALELGMGETEADSVRIAGHLHDIGKIGVADSIIDKPRTLDPAEFESMKVHCVIGAALVEQVEPLRVFSSWVRGHHERWDGEGYPDRLAAESIPLEARIICVVDSWDAMTSSRAYGGLVDPGSAIEELKARSGRQFDPRLVEAFARLFKAGRLPLLIGREELIGA